MEFKSIRLWAAVIGTVSILLLLVILLFGKSTIDKFSNIKENWASYTSKSTTYTATLNEVTLKMGYVGFIHHFKNYVLRRDEKYLPLTQEKLTQLMQLLEKLDQQTNSKAESQAIAQLRHTFLEYGEKLIQVKRMIEKGNPSADLDRIARVDDSAALRALRFLVAKATERSALQQFEMNKSFFEAQNFFNQGKYFLILIPIIALLLIFFLRKLVQSNRMVHEAKSQIDKLIDDAPAAILCVNSEGRITRSNSQAEKLFGYTAQEFLALQIEALIPEQFRETHIGQRNQYSDKPYDRPMGSIQDLRAMKKNGDEFPAEIGISISGDAVTRSVTMTISDETERLKAKNEIEEARRKAEEAYRQLEKTQEAIIQSEKMAALGGLVAGVAHEINTPVGNSLAAATHLSVQAKKTSTSYTDEELTGEALEAFLDTSIEATGLMESNCRRAAHLIQSFKQVAVDQSSGEHRSFMVKEYFDEILLGFMHKLKRSNIDVNIVCPDDLEIYNDPGVLAQVLTNLISNSLLHGFDEAATGTIKIRVARKDDDLELIYSDTGKGISDEIANKIFDPFFTTKRGAGGSGLGLNIVYNLVQNKLLGQIVFDKSKSGGVQFTLCFPANNE